MPPSGEISRRVEISMALEATPETGELGLTATIPLIDKATVATGPAGVPWVHEHDRNACPLSLVVDERSQLPEAPTRVLVALAFANRRPATDVRQLFQHKRGFRYHLKNPWLKAHAVAGCHEGGKRAYWHAVHVMSLRWSERHYARRP